jgi:hypothetical protein
MGLHVSRVVFDRFPKQILRHVILALPAIKDRKIVLSFGPFRLEGEGLFQFTFRFREAPFRQVQQSELIVRTGQARIQAKRHPKRLNSAGGLMSASVFTAQSLIHRRRRVPAEHGLIFGGRITSRGRSGQQAEENIGPALHGHNARRTNWRTETPFTLFLHGLYLMEDTTHELILREKLDTLADRLPGLGVLLELDQPPCEKFVKNLIVGGQLDSASEHRYRVLKVIHAHQRFSEVLKRGGIGGPGGDGLPQKLDRPAIRLGGGLHHRFVSERGENEGMRWPGLSHFIQQVEIPLIEAGIPRGQFTISLK